MSKIKRINLIGPINTTGYGIHFHGFKQGLLFSDRRNELVMVSDVNNKEHNDTGVTPYDKLFHGEDVVTIKLWHDFDLDPGLDTYNIGYTAFELDRFENPSHINNPNVHEIWVPSHWAKGIVEKALTTSKPVNVVPEFGGQAKSALYKNTHPGEKFALNIGKFEKRKGHHLLLEAWKELNIPLVCIWHNPFMRIEDIVQIMASFGWFIGHKITMFGEELYQFYNKDSFTTISVALNRITFIGSFINTAEFGVFPYLAEGWNLPLCEMMMRNVPCIATNYSGPTEYINEKNCVLLNNYKMEVAKDGIFFNCKEAQWAVPDVEEIVKAVKETLPENRTQIGNNLLGFEWTWRNSADIALKRLHEIKI